MSRNQAICYFCSKPDDSIQVICASRCLICSRCQLVPSIRKLLLDHCEIVPVTSLHNNSSSSALGSTGASAGATNRSRGAKNHLPPDSVRLEDMNQVLRETSSSSVLLLPQNFAASLAPAMASTCATTLLNSSNLVDEAIAAVRTASSVQMCMRGACPICNMPISVGMLQIVLEYKEAMSIQSEEEANGRSSAHFELEEVSPLIPNFLKRYK